MAQIKNIQVIQIQQETLFVSKIQSCVPSSLPIHPPTDTAAVSKRKTIHQRLNEMKRKHQINTLSNQAVSSELAVQLKQQGHDLSQQVIHQQ